MAAGAFSIGFSPHAIRPNAANAAEPRAIFFMSISISLEKIFSGNNIEKVGSRK
jgi:hypothetical protein